MYKYLNLQMEVLLGVGFVLLVLFSHELRLSLQPLHSIFFWGSDSPLLGDSRKGMTRRQPYASDLGLPSWPWARPSVIGPDVHPTC